MGVLPASTRRAVDGRLEHVAASAAEAVRQAIIGAPSREREADHRVGRDPVVEAGGVAERARRPVVASGQRVTAGVGLAAIACGPDAPAVRIGRGFGLVNRARSNRKADTACAGR
jgi:hypothetical protein